MVGQSRKFIILLVLISLLLVEIQPAFAVIDGTTDLSGVLYSVPTATMADIPKLKERIWITIMRGVSYALVEAFTSRFVNKLVEKYKIRNYLYYDQVLTNYYLNRYLADKISDPDLQNIYELMYRGYITGESTGTTGGPDPNAAVIPRLKQAIYKVYLESGGIPSDTVFDPSTRTSNVEYYAAAQTYWLGRPSYTEQNLQGQFGSFQSAATTAAQLEVIVGNGLKAGRFVGSGTCSISYEYETEKIDNFFVKAGLIKKALAEEPPAAPGVPVDPNGNLPGTQIPIENPPFDPNSSPAACQAAGGRWTPAALDQARSFIDNPSFFVNNWLQGVISSKSNSNFDPSNFWFAIGSSLGKFLANQLFLDKQGGVLKDDPRPYTPFDDNLGAGNGVGYDIDGDGIIDGYDYDGDGQMDVCIYGGDAPNCLGSRQSTTIPPPPSGGGGGGATICPSDEISLDVVYHVARSEPVNGVYYDRLSVHVDNYPDGSEPLGPDLVDDDPFHVPPSSALNDFGNIFIRTSGGAGGYIAEGGESPEKRAAEAAGVRRHTKIPTNYVIDGYITDSNVLQINLSNYASESLTIGGYFRGTNSGDGRAEVCTPRSNVHTGLVIPQVP
ncbi:MAG: hypothetical protein HY336_01395 [Candidatus Doudnabacteria bacterium]|nr:hypothetical protein [Candidatus Doudnabacteria bacterium]